MKGITYTQIAQYVVLITAYTIPAIFISLQLTGNPLPQLGLGSTLAGSDMYLLDKLDLILVDLGFQEYTTTLRGSTLNMVAFTASHDRDGRTAPCHYSVLYCPKCGSRSSVCWLGAGIYRDSLHHCTRHCGNG